jgi:hypothetical protein
VEDYAPERLNPNREIPLTGRTVRDFWAWGFSDVLTNISRAVFAEWIVGSALDAVNGIRPVWEYYDLDYAGAKIEVKSMAHLQNWKRPERVQNSFDITATGASFPVEPEAAPGPDTQYYYEAEKKRRAEVYVFAIYAEREPTRLDPLDLEAWEFLVLSTPELERHFGSQDSVALSRIEAVTKAVGYEDLRARVDEALEHQSSNS